MTLPYRIWTDIKTVTLKVFSADNDDSHIDDWTTDHLIYGFGRSGFIGHWWEAAGKYHHWHPIFRPKGSGFALLTSMDECVDYGFWFTLALSANTGAREDVIFKPFVMSHPVDPHEWDDDLANGKYYDGVNAWSQYPPGSATNYFQNYTLDIATELPFSEVSWIGAYPVGGPWGHNNQADFFRNGIRVFWQGDGGTYPVGSQITGWFEVQKIRSNYFNPVVNSLSQNYMPAAGGVSLILTGLGFDQDDVELSGLDRYPYNGLKSWTSLVDHIDFIGLQGQGTTRLDRPGDFSVDSDLQITIPSMPALAYGTYEIRLFKDNVGPAPMGISVYAYVGDWIADEDGLCRAGTRLHFFVGELEDRTPREGKPIILTDWQLKKKLDLSLADRSYSPKDVCCTAKFYDGRLKEISGLQREVNDKTGVFVSSDMTAKLVNVDKEFSKLLAEYYFKNEPVEMFMAFRDYPEAFKTQFFKGFVEDHSLKGGEFDVSIRDLTTVFFQRKIPFYRITKDDYPLAHDSAIGRPMQEAIGLLSYIATEASGAMEAFLIDTTAHKYIAARGSLKAILQVYKDGALVNPANYAIVYADGGRTYIDFTGTQGESKVTYNCEGYMYGDWNSVNGFVQHPVYVFLFYLMLLVGVPINYVDFDSFEKVKEILDDLDPGVPTSGYLGLIEEQDAMGITQEFCQTIGGSLFPDRFGRLKLAMKDISNISTSKFIFAGIDTMDSPQQDWNLKEAVNRVKVNWNYIPAATRYLESKEEEREDAVKALSGNRQESQQTLDMKWTTNEELAKRQMFNVLYKRGKGYKRIKMKLPLTFIEELDIYDSFRLQDPFGVSLDGSGDYGRFLYVEKILYNWIENSMDIDALDLTYILRRYLVLGDENSLPANWNITTEESKAFAYVCEEMTGLFADRDYGKILVDENKIAM